MRREKERCEEWTREERKEKNTISIKRKEQEEEDEKKGGGGGERRREGWRGKTKGVEEETKWAMNIEMTGARGRAKENRPS